jgi:endonuclease G
MKSIKLLLLLLLVNFSFGQLPLKDVNIYQRDGYVLSYNEEHEQANWVYYRININDLVCVDDSLAKRKNYLKEDKGIETGSALLDDYKKTGFDRGHLKPSASERCDQNQMDETFLMSNMSPQYPSLNRGIWKRLESNVRDSVLASDSVVVITGPILTSGLDKIGDVSIPEYFFKIIRVYKNGNEYLYSYLIPNLLDKNSYKKLEQYLVDLRKIEYYSGIKF